MAGGLERCREAGFPAWRQAAADEEACQLPAADGEAAGLEERLLGAGLVVGLQVAACQPQAGCLAASQGKARWLAGLLGVLLCLALQAACLTVAGGWATGRASRP
jgi:hypothetical protein